MPTRHTPEASAVIQVLGEGRCFPQVVSGTREITQSQQCVAQVEPEVDHPPLGVVMSREVPDRRQGLF
jgi:hypothetical protein